ncbi:LCP family protein [Candidatus Saccharibacteria bacterium]|nr:LCP family protein [Candidatus Saccharibacteria bacterium]
MDTPQPPSGRRFDGPARRVRRQPEITPVVAPTQQTPPEGDPWADGLALPAREPVAPVMPAIQPETTPKQGSGKVKRPHRRRRWITAIVSLIVVGVVAWFGIHAWLALRSIIQKHTGTNALNGELDLSSLKGEGSGRVNILVMGIGGEGHDGPNLSDTMMVWSIDPKTYDVAAISVPRDLYVKIPGYGYGKINAANSDGGPALAEKVVSNVLGVTINYYVVADFSGFKQAVDAVGGVDINVATALYDTTYPCDVGNGICPYHQPAGLIHMNGATALKYSRCRHDAPVGNCGNDYGRAARQQQVIEAVKAKALSAGTLTNPAKLTALIDTVGGHVKTDLQLSDIKKLALLSTKIDSSKITNKVLDDAPDNYLVGGTDIIPAAGYIYVPKAGTFNYSDIHDFVKNIFVDHYITNENAIVEVDNGSGVTGIAGTVVTSLKAAHYNVLPAANADATYQTTVIYDYTNGKKPYTIKYLEDRFGVTAKKMTASPTPTATSTVAQATTAQTPEIRIILGRDFATSSQANTSN